MTTEREGIQDYDWHRQRSWKVLNDNVANGLGTPVGYKLEPSAAIPSLLDPDSPGGPPGARDRAHAVGHAATARTSAGRAASSRT